MRFATFFIPFLVYYFGNHLVSAGVSVEFSSLLSDADKLMIVQMQDGGQSAAEASEISGRAPKMAYTTFEESEQLRMRLLHRASRAAKEDESHFVHKSNSSTNADKSSTAKEARESRMILRSNSRVGGGHQNYNVGEARTVPLLFMGLFGMVEFFVLTAVGLALITPVLGGLLLVIKFMFTAGLIMIG